MFLPILQKSNVMSFVIVFGIRSTKIKERDLIGETKCPECGARNSYIVSGRASYFHLFWIIAFPLRKRLVFVCKNCGHVVRPQEKLPESIARVLKTTDKVKRPIWHYTGFMLIAFFILSIMYLQFEESVSDYQYEQVIEQREQRQLEESKLVFSDIALAKVNPTFKEDSISNALLKNVDFGAIGFDLNQLAFFSKLKGKKLLMLLHLKEKPSNYNKAMGKVTLLRAEQYLYKTYFNNIDEVHVGITDVEGVLDTQQPRYSYSYNDDAYPLQAFYDTSDNYALGSSSTEIEHEKRVLITRLKSEMSTRKVDSMKLARNIKRALKKHNLPMSKGGASVYDTEKYYFMSYAGYELPKELEVLEAVVSGEGPFRSLGFMSSEVRDSWGSFRNRSLERMVNGNLHSDDGKIRQYSKSPYWVEFYDDYLNQYFLDFMPGENGTMGQIFVIDQTDSRRVVAKSMTEFFDLYFRGKVPFDLEDWTEDEE